jgi:hypothetical protein
MWCGLLSWLVSWLAAVAKKKTLTVEERVVAEPAARVPQLERQARTLRVA